MARRFKMSHPMAAAALAVVALWPAMAGATLGQPEASVQSDGIGLHGSIKQATDHPLYRVHEIQLPSGTAVREYADLNGFVFAVAWQGPFMPNLRQMLGAYFDDYATAAQSHGADHRHLEIRRADLVVQSAGHMRAFAGRAYLPQALPAGVAPGELQ
jgi:hypothetical protein